MDCSIRSAWNCANPAYSARQEAQASAGGVQSSVRRAIPSLATDWHLQYLLLRNIIGIASADYSVHHLYESTLDLSFLWLRPQSLGKGLAGHIDEVFVAAVLRLEDIDDQIQTC